MKTAIPSTAKDAQNPTTSSRTPLPNPQSGRLAQVAAMMNQSPRVQAQLKLRDEIQNSQRIQNQLAMAADINHANHAGSVAQARLMEEEPAQREAAPTPNCTGLPDQLKAGVESLSGLSLDDVKVHYNSAKPTQLNALAYAQGTDIHVAPGQEKHLPHEAWHIAQQKQGRVRPTMQMKQGIPAATIQLKPTGKVTTEYIQKIIAEIPDEDLRSQLEDAWKLLGPKGEAYFDDEAEKFRGGYDPEQGTAILYIPEDKFYHFGDLSIEQKGIAIHELTHVAEVFANTKGLTDMPDDLSKIMETDLPDLVRTVEGLFRLLDSEEKTFKAVGFRSSTMYDYVDERLKYAYQYLTAERNFEFPTVLNQIIYVIEQKSSKDGKLRKTELYAALLGLQKQATESRALRARHD